MQSQIGDRRMIENDVLKQEVEMLVAVPAVTTTYLVIIFTSLQTSFST